MIIDEITFFGNGPVPLSEFPDDKLDEAIKLYFSPPSDPSYIISKIMEKPELITNPNSQILPSDNVYKLVAEKMRRLQSSASEAVQNSSDVVNYFWITKEGVIKLISQMDNSHLLNAIKFLQRLHEEKIQKHKDSIDNLEFLMENNKIDFIKSKLKNLEENDPSIFDKRYNTLVEEHNSRLTNPDDYIVLKNGNICKKKKIVLNPNQKLTWCRTCLKGVLAFYKEGNLINAVNKDGTEHYSVCNEYEPTGYNLDETDWDEPADADLWDWKGGISRQEMKKKHENNRK